MAKDIFATMWVEQCDATAIIKQRGLSQLSEESELTALVAQVLSEQAAQVTQYREANESKRKKMLGFFVGQLMKKSAGRANPTLANQLFLHSLNRDLDLT